MLVLLPTFNDSLSGRVGTSTRDSEAASVIGRLLESSGLRENKHWVRIAVETPLEDEDLSQNLLVLCGSNLMCQVLLSRDKEFLRNIGYEHSEYPGERYFLWRGHRFRCDERQDFAVIVVRRNPFNPAHRIILLFGLRNTGTLAAAKLFSEPEFKDARRQLSQEFGTSDGEIDVLLRVDLSESPESAQRVRRATIGDGEPAESPHLLPIEIDVHSLNRIAISLKQHPRQVRLNDFVYELTFTKEYDVRIHREFTWSCAEADVVVQHLTFGSDVELPRLQDLEFSARTVSGVGELVALPARNELKQKEFLLFPIPPILKADDPRRYAVDAFWPSAGRKLRDLGAVDRNRIQLPDAEGPIDRVTFRVRFETGESRFQIVPLFPGATPLPSSFGEHMPFEHEAHNVPPQTVYSVEITRIK